ncbi:MAG TPA: hypothetical protein VMW36_10825 [Patescibacteria group bacterium]|nr:hypothetical protein [Patescibacteria group bacterium]
MATVNFRGESNVYKNAVLNCVEVLKKFPAQSGREIRDYYTEDVLNPNPPCFTVLMMSSTDERRSSQNLTQIRYTINVGLEVWYYHADVTEETKRNEITYVLWEINQLLKTNITLNGFCPKLGVEILGARYEPRRRGSRVLAGGALTLVAKALYTSTITS